MPRHAVGDGDAPGQRGRQARGLVDRTGQEAADAADAHGRDQRVDEEDARGARDDRQLLHELDADQSAEETADHGLAGEEVGEGVARIREGRQQSCAEGRSECGSGKDGGAVALGEAVAAACAQDDVHRRARQVAEDLEGEMYAEVARPLHQEQDIRMRLRILTVTVIAIFYATVLYTENGCGTQSRLPLPEVA